MSISYRKSGASFPLSYRTASDWDAFLSEEDLSAHGQEHLSDNPSIQAIFKEEAENLFDALDEDFEFWQPFNEAISDWDDGPGYSSITDGGYEVFGYCDLSTFVGGGFRTGNQKLNEAIDTAESNSYDNALRQFKEEYKDDIKDIPEDKLNYHDLYEMDKGTLAERLSEMEHDAQDELVSVKFRIGYKNPERVRETLQSRQYPGCYLFFDVDGPGNYKNWYDESFVFSSLSYLKTYLRSRLNVFKNLYVYRDEKISCRRII